MIKYLEDMGIIAPKNVYTNLPVATLVEKALERGEGILADNGALCVTTGKYTGRSPNDRFVVEEDENKHLIDWGKVNVPISEEKYQGIYNKLTAYMQNRDVFIFDGFAGADPKYRKKIRVINELASENLFMRNLLVRPTAEEQADFVPDYTILCAPGLKCIPEVDGTRSEAAVLMNFKERMILIAGSQYAGEMKKSVFGLINFLLPQEDVLSMHCSANVNEAGEVALFFGLSGTGKTTLSADPDRKLIGDDEHCWSNDGVFNVEGGCYAKCINLTYENEPQIWDAVRFGTLVENVVIDPETRALDYDDDSLTENTRAGYPVDFIPNALVPAIAGHPKTVIFLTADAFGVLPPVSKLTKDQAMYHFVSGYTSKLAGTERGIVEPQTTFSTCFGAPFLPLKPSVYAEMLGQKIDEHDVNVYLINTGWSGGKYGVGKRMSIKHTRAMVTAALNGDLERGELVLDEIFNVYVPTSCPNVPSEVLNPKSTWEDKEAYDVAAKDLAARFKKNFEKYSGMPQNIIDAGPKG